MHPHAPPPMEIHWQSIDAANYFYSTLHRLNNLEVVFNQMVVLENASNAPESYFKKTGQDYSYAKVSILLRVKKNRVLGKIMKALGFMNVHGY
jgi:hypothetical protein